MNTADEIPQLAPLDPSQPYALRMALVRRYWHLVLKFTHPYLSDSGRYEASWISGDAVADTETELLAKVLEAMGDCGDEKHMWITKSEVRDPLKNDNLLVTQRLHCPYCDKRDRTITIYHPQPTDSEVAADGNDNGS